MKLIGVLLPVALLLQVGCAADRGSGAVVVPAPVSVATAGPTPTATTEPTPPAASTSPPASAQPSAFPPPPAPSLTPVVDDGAITGIRIRSINPEGGWSEARVRIAHDRSAVTVDWQTGAQIVTRTYGRVIVDELLRQWGSLGFDITGWRSDICERSRMTWIAEAGGKKRFLCHEGLEVRRLAEFKSTIQVLMSGP